MAGNSPERPAQLGKPVAPSQGGHGEVLPRSRLEDEVHRVLDFTIPDVKEMISNVVDPLMVEVRSIMDLENGELAAWSDWHDDVLLGDMLDDIPELTQTVLAQSRKNLDFINATPYFNFHLSSDEIYEEFYSDLDEFESPIKARIFDIIQSVNKNLKQDIQNAIIAGTRKWLLSAKSIDKSEIIVDNDAVSYVRWELVKLEEKIINKFIHRMTEEINEILEEN
jgi:hypothetical protein